ncbi:MAG: TatD family hydrolase [Lentisphaeria bacterium]|nr:TatD family hydrolase [Lentisphaeria bacterium]NQZ67892.1 TatD family hydrolase [Lentisphaeria bacterium]
MAIWQKLSEKIIDTHCHLQDFDNPLAYAAELEQKKIHVHTVTISPGQYLSSKDTFKDFSYISPALGWLPFMLKDPLSHKDLFFDLIDQTTLIGEIGLDYKTDDEADRKLQRQIFEMIVDKSAETKNKVLSIHTRCSAEDTLAIIGPTFPGTIILHWYSGSPLLMKDLPENYFLSVNNAMIKSRNGKEILKEINPQQVLTESDGPYLDKPENIKVVIESLASRWDMSIEEAADLIYKNYHRAMKNEL